MKKIDKYLLLVICLTILGFGILMGIYNVYPFGSNIFSIIDFDYGYIPVYYKLWDILHFNSPVLFDWNLGAGLNAFASLIGNGFISPLCWIIGIFPRDSIPYTISYIYLIKMIFTSIITYYSIGKILPNTKNKNKVLFTLMYTFSSYTFLMSSNLLYLDAFALFPLLVYSLKELLDKGHWKLYMGVLTFILMSSYYMAYLDLLFIIGFSAFYLIFMDTQEKKIKAVKVLICTLTSLLLSCVIFLPGFMGIRDSARMANNISNDTIFSYFMDKSIYLFTLAIPFILTIKQLFIKKDKKLNYFIISMLLFLLLGVVFEPINAMWHTGSHSGFPFRYSFQIVFFLVIVSVYYINNNYKDNKNNNLVRLIVPGVGMGLLLYSFFLIKNQVLGRELFALKVEYLPDYIYLLFLFILSLVIFIFILRNNKKYAYILTCILFSINVLIFGNLYLEFGNVDSSVYMQKLYDNFKLENDNYNYMMELNESNYNFPYILRVPSIANRLHFIRSEELDQAKYMGYQTRDTIIEAKGGNIFFDTLLQNKYYFSNKELDSNYYELKEEHKIDKDVKLYQSKYNLNYIIPYNGNEYKEKNNDLFENVNSAYKTLFNGNDLYKEELVDYSYENNELKIHFKENNTYYVFLKYKAFSEFSYLDNENIEISDLSIKDMNMVNFTAKVNNEGDFIFIANNTFEDIKVYSFDKDEFINFIDNHTLENVSIKNISNKRGYNVKLDNDTSVLIPINYSDKYIIKVNDEVIDYKCNLYNMISLDLKKGDNKIEIEYDQKWLRIGFIISIVTLLLVIIFNFINNKYRLLGNKIILWPLFIISLLCFGFLILKVYILSFI